MKNLFMALVARAIEAKTQHQMDVLSNDIEALYQRGELKEDEHGVLLRLIDKLDG